MGDWVQESSLQLLSQLGHTLLGFLVGELLHRIILLIEENFNLEKYNGSRYELLKAVFSNCHGQSIKVPFLGALGAGLIWSCSLSPQIILTEFEPILRVALLYALMRSYGAFEHRLEELEVLEENNAHLGPGLAANYWFSFLKWMVKGDLTDAKGEKSVNDLKDAIIEAKINAEEGDQGNIEPDGGMMTKLKQEGGVHFAPFEKLIILLPKSCHLKTKGAEDWKKENVFILCHPDAQGEPLCQCKIKCDPTCIHRNCSHDFHFKLDPIMKRDPIKMTVHWIYENEDDERIQNSEGNKIFVMFDFPMLLQSAMGPGKGWEEDDRPGARTKNIRTFKETLNKFLNSNEYKRYRHMITFHEYDDVGEGEKCRPMSAQLREKINQDMDHAQNGDASLLV